MPHASTPLTRRRWLQRAGALGGLPLVFQVPGASLALAAAAPHPDAVRAERRLVVVMLRGALDGLAAVPALGDPAWPGVRPPNPQEAASLPLDGFFGLHPALGGLHRWYGEGRLLVAHAVATSYRERSHFDAQQLLESGGLRPFERSTGWLGRALQASNRGAVAMTPGLPVALRGAEGASSWAPTRIQAADDDLLDRLGRVMADDPALAATYERARAQQQGGLAEASRREGGAGFIDLARQAGRFLEAPNGPAVAWLESSGWDTHAGQAARLARLLPTLDGGLAALREALGARWATTTVVVHTEFGRAVSLNGSGGTDHGTAGVAFVAGGEVQGGRVRTDWPGLAPRDRLDGRDLRPTQDLRGLLKAVAARQFGLDGARLDGEVLPGGSAPWSDLWTA